MMNTPKRSGPTLASSDSLLRHAWWIATIAVLALIAWIHLARVDRVEYLTGTASWSTAAPVADAQSLTGYENGQRRLIVPGHHNPSYEWIELTQDGIQNGMLRVREVSGDNAPNGRIAAETAPYRWYLTALAFAHHIVSNQSWQQAVERAALHADPLLQLMLVGSAALFGFRRFGAMAGSLMAVGSFALFPLGGNFQAGAPDVHSMAWLCALWSILPLLPGNASGSRSRARRDFAAAGAFAGLGIWIDSQTGLLVALGIVLGGLGQTLSRPRRDAVDETFGSSDSPWLIWSVASAAVCCLGYAIEYLPNGLSWSLDSIHALHAVALLGSGAVLVQADRWRQCGRAAWGGRGVLLTLGGVASLATLPIAALLTESGFRFGNDLYASELANHPAATVAAGMLDWIARDGSSYLLWAVCLPVGLLVAALIGIAYPKCPASDRSQLCLVAGPAIIALAMAVFQLRWWNLFDVALLPIALALLNCARRWRSGPKMLWSIGGVFVLAFGPGLYLSAKVDTDAARPLDELEVQAVIERDLAYWLTLRARSDDERPVVFSSPSLSEALRFYGGLRGIVSHAWENEQGMSAAQRIASASTWDEASLLLNDRGVRYVVLPSWDRAFDSLIRIARQTPPESPLPPDTLVNAISNWNLPPWLRAMPYSIPQEAVFEEYRALTLAVQAPQDEPLATCRLAEYFLEMGMLREAAAAREQLELYPRDLSALATQAQVSLMLGDRPKFEQSLQALLPYLSRRSARSLPFDRRVSLAILLVSAKRLEEARAQMELALVEMDSERIQQLTTSALVRVLAIARILDLKIADPELRQEIFALIPPAIQEKIRKGD